MMYIERTLTPVLRRFAGQYPVIAVVGPRQSGKTTLVRHIFDAHPYVTLEDPDERRFATEDPRSFLARFEGGAILDEIQRAPDLLSYLQGVVDRDPAPGRFVLTGSQQFNLVGAVTQSLAGRVAMLTLLPFSLGELVSAGRGPTNLDALLFSGLYPPIHDRGAEPSPWYGNYVATYVERDVRQMLQVKDLSVFQRFVQLCAGRTGQLVNFSSLAMDAGISQPTAAGWLSVMQAAHLVYLLKPHHRSFDKRLIKTPKLYFLDTGLACRLLGIASADDLSIHPMRGALFESWTIAELLKARLHQARPDDLYFWRDRSGHEVDVLLTAFRESRSVGIGVPQKPIGRLVPVEVKSGRTIAGDWTAGLGWWRRLAGDEAGAPWLVYGGDTSFERSGVRFVGWRDMPESGLL